MCNNATASLCINGNTMEQIQEYIPSDIDNSSDKLEYIISFNNNWTKNNIVSFQGYFEIDEKFDRMLFCDVIRPTRKLELVLKVSSDVHISNVKRNIINFYGDNKSISFFEKNRQSILETDKSIKKDNVDGKYTEYRYIVKRPKQQKRYFIYWDNNE